MPNLKKYNVSEEQYATLIEPGRCPLCNKRWAPSRVPCIDHDHITGKVRGVLCSNCNWTIGVLKENVGWLEAAARYLRYPPAELLWGADVPRVPDAPPERTRK